MLPWRKLSTTSVFTIWTGEEDKKQKDCSGTSYFQPTWDHREQTDPLAEQPEGPIKIHEAEVSRHRMSENKGQWSPGDGTQTRWALWLPQRATAERASRLQPRGEKLWQSPAHWCCRNESEEPGEQDSWSSQDEVAERGALQGERLLEALQRGHLCMFY